MSTWLWVAIGALALYLAFIAALLLAGRSGQARAVAGFVPDCAVLFKRLAGDPRVPRRRRFTLILLAAYLAMPIDLVPDFIPVAGQLDDAILVAIVLRGLARGSGAALIEEHWPGPRSSLNVVLRVAGIASAPAAA